MLLPPNDRLQRATTEPPGPEPRTQAPMSRAINITAAAARETTLTNTHLFPTPQWEVLRDFAPVLRAVLRDKLVEERILLRAAPPQARVRTKTSDT